MKRCYRKQLFVVESRKSLMFTMQDRRVMFWLSVFALACIIVLMMYVQYSTIPGQVITNYNMSNSSVTVEQVDANKISSISNPSAVRHKTEGKVNFNVVPLMAFEDLGVNKKKVMLLIIVTTAPQRFDRRQAIRDTWWKHCAGDKVHCVFITDGFIVDLVQRNRTIHEKILYGDMELQPLLGGREFGLRFLNQIKWAKVNFEFQYLLRIDDDYFLCLKRLLSELPLRPKENLVWGHFHCEAGITWIDESFVLVSQDIIYKFLSQNESTMLCHAHADQQIGLWLENISTKEYFHDARLYHDPPASFAPQFENPRNVCSLYLGLHGTYVKKMRDFDKNSNDGKKAVHPIPRFSSFCKTMTFDYRRIGPPYHFDPKPCKDNPSWDVERKMYVGREKN